MKKVEKLLDKRLRARYNKKVAEYSGGPVKTSKTFEKVLDKRNEVMYNSNVPPEAACTL